MRFEDRTNALDGLPVERFHILTEIDGEIGFPIRLIGGDGGAGNRADHFLRNLLQLGTLFAANGRRIEKTFLEFSRALVMPEIERPIFANHRIHGPHAGDVITPAGGSAGDGHDLESRFFKGPQRLVGACRDFAVGGKSVIDIEEDAFEVLAVSVSIVRIEGIIGGSSKLIRYAIQIYSHCPSHAIHAMRTVPLRPQRCPSLSLPGTRTVLYPKTPPILVPVILLMAKRQVAPRTIRMRPRAAASFTEPPM